MFPISTDPIEDRLILELQQAEAKAESLSAQNSKVSAELDEANKTLTLYQAVEKFNFSDASDVIALLSKRVSLNKTSGQYLDKQGRSLDQTLQELAATKPHWLKSTAHSADSVDTYTLEELFGKHSKSMLTQRFKKENPARYRALREQAIKRGLIAA